MSIRIDGVVLLDKPAGMSSQGAVTAVKRALNAEKAGHTGTLDPMATGVLVLGFNNGTRLLQYITDGDKSYQATVVLGASTVTDDFEGEVISTADASAITDEQINAELDTMRGTFMQRPSSVSAVKVDGERAYDRVRSGETVVLASREVTISQLDVLAIRRIDKKIEIDIEVTCSAGTYIRSIARDLGAKLSVGGYVSELRRTSIGPFVIAEALTFDQLDSTHIESHLIEIQSFLSRLTP